MYVISVVYLRGLSLCWSLTDKWLIALTLDSWACLDYQRGAFLPGACHTIDLISPEYSGSTPQVF